MHYQREYRVKVVVILGGRRRDATVYSKYSTDVL